MTDLADDRSLPDDAPTASGRPEAECPNTSGRPEVLLHEQKNSKPDGSVSRDTSTEPAARQSPADLEIDDGLLWDAELDLRIAVDLANQIVAPPPSVRRSTKAKRVVEKREQWAADVRHAGRRRRKRVVKKPVMLHPRQLNARVRERYESIIASVIDDLGGPKNITAMQMCLIESFAGITLHVADAQAQLLIGEPVDLKKHAMAVATMTRLSLRIGLKRREPVAEKPLSLAEYLAARKQATDPTLRSVDADDEAA